MKSLTKILLGIVLILAAGIIVLKFPAPMSQEQREFDEAIFTAQRLTANGKAQNALDILETLEEEFPSTSIYIELEKEGCYKGLKQYDKIYESCLNSKLTEYMPSRAALCSKQLALAGRFDDALAIWDKDIQDRPEEVFPYCNINAYEQWRTKTNMKIKNFFSKLMYPEDMTASIKAQSIAYVNELKNSQNKKKTK